MGSYFSIPFHTFRWFTILTLVNHPSDKRRWQDLDQCQLNESAVLRTAKQLGETALHLAQSYPEYFPKGRPPKGWKRVDFYIVSACFSNEITWKSHMESLDLKQLSCSISVICLYLGLFLFFATKMVDFGANLSYPATHDVSKIHCPSWQVMAANNARRIAWRPSHALLYRTHQVVFSLIRHFLSR